MTSIGIDCQGGKGNASFAIDISPRLAANIHGTPHAVSFIVDPLASNSMKSSNPHSGFHKSEYSPTLDTSQGLNPIRNGGGLVIVEVKR